SASPSRATRATRTVRGRGRAPHDHDSAADRALDVPERPRARARQTHWRWPGVVELVHDSHTMTVPGTWTMESGPAMPSAADRLAGDTNAFPSVATESAEWVHRLRRVLTLQEPGMRVGVGSADAHGWQSLQVTVPTRPLTLLHVDRDAMGQVLGTGVTMRFRIEG
ncbi:MAG: hypothetical protein ACK54K_08445, partial [Gemmatimonadaceae bacterium]